MRTIKMITNALATVALLLVASASCGSSSSGNDEPEPAATITVSPASIDAAAGGATVTLAVTSSRSEWSVAASDASKGWITATKAGSSVTVTVAANNTQAARTGAVVVRSGAAWKEVPVTQSAPLLLSASQLYSNSSGQTLTVTVQGPEGWTATTSDSWIAVAKPNATTFTVTTSANTTTSFRQGTVTVALGNESHEVTVRQESAEESAISTPEGYHLVWHDEFNQGTELGADWVHEVQNSGWVNDELQNYVNGSFDGRRVTELVDGKLNINCFKADNGKVYSGRVYAKPNEGWLYGYFEARIMLPSGKGTWPAWWMMPANNDYAQNPWPGCGEIDIMEEVGADPNMVSSTIHCNRYNNGGTATEHAERHFPTAESDYHVYACEWTPEFIRFIFDGEVILTYRNANTGKDQWPFTVPFYPILNLAWGGAWGGYKGVDDSALPVTMKVDYVRIFQKNQ